MKKLKKIVFAGIMTIMLSTSVFAVGKLPKEAVDKNIDIYINNNIQSIPEDMGRAYLDKDTNRVMVPIRYISENMGAQINYYQKKEAKTSGILIGAVDVLVEIDINSTKAKVNKAGIDNIIDLDSPAILYDGRTYVPIRFISETLGLSVDWKDNSVYISGKFKTKGKRYNYEENNKESKVNENNTDDAKKDKSLEELKTSSDKEQDNKSSYSIF
ncbi:MAG: copper amine oxidase N-terminal domain-containing protein [Peptoniphilus sp.]|uniref:copper amine oxidase N-terminal domain-containing protein n=1 Tax=Peptoniphilus sp. TaxID=1971214 RepID=UPI0025F0B7DF|nr:copper amine oxidase N-terminal domain-containing protein [Peptoniphilus sp.]MCI5642820.1 copper amine oxidase N-terminal domain-containing protein [Peptoniphilus sp.]MDD7352787.1 copper amine oxidase N-terminal domain-containing protein [Peptoniphilaceae bacterium]